MDFRQLRYFVSVVDSGSFTAAAERLRIAQPSLSQHVIALEKELGVKLLERQSRGVRVTASGAVFLEHAQTVLADLNRARDAVTATGADVAGRVVVGMPTTIAPLLAVPLLEACLKSLPSVKVHLVESHSGFLREWLDALRLDVALLFNVTDAAGLELTPLVAEELYLISAASAAGKVRQVTLREVQKLDLIMAGRSHDLRNTLDSVAFATSGALPVVKAEVDSLSTVKQMVLAGIGHTILPRSAVHRELSDRSLVARRIVRPRIERYAAMATIARRPKTRAQQAVSNLILKLSGELIAGGDWMGRSTARTI